MEETLIFDIYVIAAGNGPRLVERVTGLSLAKERLANLAAQAPGRYYLWNSYSLEMISSLDTGRNGQDRA